MLHCGKRRVLLLLLVTLPIGCAARPRSEGAPADKPAAPLQLSASPDTTRHAFGETRLVSDDVQILLQLDIYRLTVPLGAISNDDRFWKHIDEDHVDLATHALLLNNGLRYGLGATEEWDYYKGIIDKYGATAQKGSTSPTRKGNFELPMAESVEAQDIFFLDDHWQLYGRSYQKCDNLIAVSFEPTPRQLGDATIEAVALVRGIRRQYEVTILNDTREIELKRPEYLYDLRLRQNVPIDHFLVIAPAPLAKLPDNLGHTFLVKADVASPTETVLVLAPRPFRLAQTGKVLPKR